MIVVAMDLARWILVSDSQIRWRLAPRSLERPGDVALPGGPWRVRQAALESPYLTRPLVLALDAPLSGALEGAVDPNAPPSTQIPLRLSLTQLEDAPGPAALREGGSDQEWMHALDEMLGCFASLSEAAGLGLCSLGVEQGVVELVLTAGEETWFKTVDRLLLCSQAFSLAAFSRGLGVTTVVNAAAELWPIDGLLYVRSLPTGLADGGRT